MAKLKFCPFCGSSGSELSAKVNEADSQRHGKLYQAQIECYTCGASGPQTAWTTTREGALKMLAAMHDDEGWNVRV